MIQLTRRKEKTLVGLEIEAGSVAAVELRTNGSSKVTATAIAPLPPGAFHDGEIGDGDELAAALRTLFADNGLGRKVRLGVANQRVVVRTLRLPAIGDEKELEAAVRFQAQEQIPMPVDEAILDFRVAGAVAADEGPPQVDVVVVAARRDMITALLGPVREAGLQPVGVDLSAFGLIRALGAPAETAPAADAGEQPAETATLYCHIGSVTNLAVARRRSCLFTRVSPAGLESIAAALASATGSPLEHARMWLTHVGLSRPLEEIEGDEAMAVATRAALESGAPSLLDELRLSLDYYGAQEGAVPISGVVLCGPGSAIDGLAEQMGAVVGLPVTIARPEALSGLDAASASRLTLPYGLALES